MILAYKACGHVCYENHDPLRAPANYREYHDTKCARCLGLKNGQCAICQSVSTP